MSCTRSLRHWLSLQFQLLRRKSLTIQKRISPIFCKRILRARRTPASTVFRERFRAVRQPRRVSDPPKWSRKSLRQLNRIASVLRAAKAFRADSSKSLFEISWTDENTAATRAIFARRFAEHWRVHRVTMRSAPSHSPSASLFRERPEQEPHSE